MQATPAVSTSAERASLADAILPGLLSSPKFTPHWYNYDSRGSELYMIAATENPFYHVFRVETALLQDNAGDIISSYDGTVRLVDLGAGNCVKPKILIDMLLKKTGTCSFYPVDIAQEFVEENARRLMADCKGLSVHPIAGENQNSLKFMQSVSGTKLITHFGNSFSTIPMNEMATFLRTVWETISEPEDRYLVGIDLNQDENAVRQAYTHGSWVDFNFNVLNRLNRDFRADFKEKNFDYCFKYVVDEREICNIKRPEFVTAGLRSKCDQIVHLGKIYMHLQ
ncbi:histidine N-alpha-methyltransferase-like [Ptychodera flava]|uniref:histidine N-alpha-methyltransferase-like n=1 Tax=Ptychodera flava TaxID=63121 RepID=UPI003969F039